MDNPIFKLEKVVQTRAAESMEDFEGPLDLILFLLSKNKIEIQDIPIALILDQYLEYLEKRQQMDLEVASEFVTMASHLMYIKTRMLLSIEDEEAQSEMDALIQSLQDRQRGECYQKIRKLTEKLGPMSEFGRNIFTKNPEPVKRGKVFEYDHEPGELAIAMQELLDRRDMALNPQLTVFEDIVKREPYSVEEKAEEIVQRVKLADKLEERGQIFILDEPTDGLHLDDIRRLMKLFNKMTDQGNTLFIIEHSLDVMKDADYIVELGPEGGQAGGEILFTGTPKEMLESSGSVTREYLSD